MPFFEFFLARTESAPSTADDLPAYTRVSQLPTYVRNGHVKQLSDIPELDEEDAFDHITTATSSRWANTLDCSSKLLQALLVDASTTLCVYLYFTSLQARIAIHQQDAADTIASLCSQLPANAETVVFHRCAEAINELHEQIDQSFPLSPRIVIGFTLLKGLCAYILLTRATRLFRPFDYLVASGALHCLALYCFFFVPVASYLQGASGDNPAVWIKIAVQFLWVAVICLLVALAHFAYVTFTRAPAPTVTMTVDEVMEEVPIAITITDSKTDIQLV